MRALAPLTTLLLLAILTLPHPALAGEDDGLPLLTPHMAQVNAGDTFDLEVSVQAWTAANHTATFANRSRFVYPGGRSVTHRMEPGDAILFKVECSVEEGTPDGDYPIAFKVEWEQNGTSREVEGRVTVKVGEGAGGEDICGSIAMMAAPSVLAFFLLIAGRRR